MAYEKEIKSALKNKFHANMGLSDSTYEKVANTLGATTTKEEEIETAVSGAEPWLKIVQGEADVIRRTTKGGNNPEPGGGHNPNNPNPQNPDPTNMEALVEAAVKKATTPLTQEIETLKKGNASKAFGEKLLGKLKDKGVDPNFYGPAIEGREFTNDSEVDAFVESLSGKYDAFNQSLADKGLSQVPKPVLGGVNKEGISTATQAFIESRKAEAKDNSLGGKQL